MRGMVPAFLVAAMLVGLPTVVGCAGSAPQPSSSPSPPQASLSPNPPIAALQALARTYKATRAWYALVPLSTAFKMLQGGWIQSPAPDPRAPTWVVVMYGRFGPPSEHFRWEVAAFDPTGLRRVQNMTSARPDTFNAKLRPLPL